MLQEKNRLAFYMACVITLLALIAVSLGSFTRLKDAGLGCPDWPGCYGHALAPTSSMQILQTSENFPGQAINSAKAWTEMVHRYVAGTLALLIFCLAILIVWQRKLPQQPTGLALGLVALVVLQALLGRWTVTLRLLPIIVLAHLLCGLTTLALSWLMVLRLRFNEAGLVPLKGARLLKPWLWLGLIVLIIQIILGGWTSTNYAALVCPDFPYCHGRLVPPLHFTQAFLMAFQSGNPGLSPLATAHIMHRIGALITTVYFFWLGSWMFIATTEIIRKLAGFILALIVLQISLGISNVIWKLPVGTAVGHTVTAGLLLLAVITLLQRLHITQNKF